MRKVGFPSKQLPVRFFLPRAREPPGVDVGDILGRKRIEIVGYDITSVVCCKLL